MIILRLRWTFLCIFFFFRLVKFNFRFLSMCARLLKCLFQWINADLENEHFPIEMQAFESQTCFVFLGVINSGGDVLMCPNWIWISSVEDTIGNFILFRIIKIEIVRTNSQCGAAKAEKKEYFVFFFLPIRTQTTFNKLFQQSRLLVFILIQNFGSVFVRFEHTIVFRFQLIPVDRFATFANFTANFGYQRFVFVVIWNFCVRQFFDFSIDANLFSAIEKEEDFILL